MNSFFCIGLLIIGLLACPNESVGQSKQGSSARNDLKFVDTIDIATVGQYGAQGDGGLHPLSEFYATLAAARADFPTIADLTLADQIDWAAWQEAINSLPDSGGCVYGHGVFVFNKQLVVGNGSYSAVSTKQGVFLTGARASTSLFAAGDHENPATEFKWEGSTVSTDAMVLFAGPGQGGGIRGIKVNGNTGRSGVHLRSWSYAQFPDLVIESPPEHGFGLKLDTITGNNPTSTGTGVVSTAYNDFGTVTIRAMDRPRSTGIILDGTADPPNTDSIGNTFRTVHIAFHGTGGIGIKLAYCDWNLFFNVVLTNSTAGTGSDIPYGVYLAGSEEHNFPKNNAFWYLQAGIGVTIGSTGKPESNVIHHYAVDEQALEVPVGTVGISGRQGDGRYLGEYLRAKAPDAGYLQPDLAGWGLTNGRLSPKEEKIFSIGINTSQGYVWQQAAHPGSHYMPLWLNPAGGEVQVGKGDWQNPMKLGTYSIWVDTAGKLRIKNGLPMSASDGQVVGNQN
ncbi:hypothetical protein HYR99_19835 [Candidatus Poribacteria bacterium]|nr:hypothetical protein [Candidatus Poribacteria bacterium]